MPGSGQVVDPAFQVLSLVSPVRPGPSDAGPAGPILTLVQAPPLSEGNWSRQQVLLATKTTRGRERRSFLPGFPRRPISSRPLFTTAHNGRNLVHAVSMARGLMYDNPGRSGRPRSDNGDSRQAPLSGPAASLGSFEPPVSVPRMPAPPVPFNSGQLPPVGINPPGAPVMGPPVGGPPMSTLPFIPGSPVGGPGLPPGVGLPGPDPRGFAGQPAGPAPNGPMIPQNINWAELLPLLQAMAG